MTTCPRFAVLVLGSLALAAPVLAQIPPMQSEFQANTYLVSYGEASGVAIDTDGRFVVTWAGYEVGPARDRCFVRRYDAAGGAESIEEQVTDFFQNGDQFESSVAKDASGRFVAAWRKAEDNSIAARRFDSNGSPLGDPFPVNTSTADAAESRVASDDAGNFVVAWTRATNEVMARVFDSSGAPVTDEFVVNEYTTDTQRARGVAMSGDGFVVTWGGEGAGGPGIWTRRFDADGDPVTGDVKANQGNLLVALSSSSVAMNASGEFVVAWGGFVPPSYEGIFARRFDALGAPLGDEFPVSVATSANRGGPQVASDRAGNFIVSWTAQNGDGDQAGIGARRYDRFGTPTSSEFVVNEITEGSQSGPHVDLNDSGTFVVAWSEDVNYGVKGRRSGVAAAVQIEVDVPQATVGSAVDENGVLEPGETVTVETAWHNESASNLVDLAGGATDFSGPGAFNLYVVEAAGAIYGTVAPGATETCTTGNCIIVTLNAPVSRPVQHWDARLQEALFVGVPHTWVLHVGESFPDVPTDNIFYAFIETLFHNGVTGGCAGGGYCPTNPVTRAQMAVFLLKAKFGSAHIPPPCTGTVFTDVPCTGGPFDPWIEELAALQITGGCGGGLYCPNNTVTRQQMAVFLLKALEGSAYAPPACTGDFDDVPCTPGTGFSDWIEELFDRGITGGCSVTPPLYCPTNPNNRGQMAAFLTKMFQLVLYGG